MRATYKCYPCLKRLAIQAIDMACDGDDGNANVRRVAIERALQVLDDQFSVDRVSITIAAALHQVIRESTGNPDPYRMMKLRELEVAREVFPVVSRRYGRGFTDRIKLAALGNTVDFFREIEAIKADMLRPIEFVIDDTNQLSLALNRANYILYLADNTGEMLFDLPLLELLRQKARVVYVVKSSPVQDDTTPDEIRQAGLEQEIGEIMTTGTATPGIDFSSASGEFLRAFQSADLIFAKGMGYYESLTELPATGRIFFCLMAKCEPVADAIGVPLHSYVLKGW